MLVLHLSNGFKKKSSVIAVAFFIQNQKGERNYNLTGNYIHLTERTPQSGHGGGGDDDKFSNFFNY